MSDDKLFDDIVERELFLELVADGMPVTSAGFECGWTPFQTRRNLADGSFAELVRFARTRAVDSVEHMLFKAAKKGNLSAMQMILYNERPDQWKDTKRIEVRSDININVTEIKAAKEVTLQLLKERGVLELQPGGILDVESSEDGDGLSG